MPILTRVVEEMHTLEPKEQNDLLKMIIDRIEYEKTESGAAIEPALRISLKIMTFSTSPITRSFPYLLPIMFS